MLPRPPLSTLFPYTTLFRSIALEPENITVHTLTLKRASNLVVEHRAAEYDDVSAMLEQSALLEDRKSTRLNSSHVSISYAVFCLKKKKNVAIYHMHVFRRSA